MERGSKRSGSVLVLVLILSTFIMVVATVSLRSGTLLYELALDRVVQLKQQRTAQALAYYGIAYCKTIRGSKPRSHTLSFDHWPLSDGIYEGAINIEPKGKGYSITAMLSSPSPPSAISGWRQREDLSSILVEIGQQKDGWRIVSWEDK